MCVLNAFKKWCANICLILSWVPRLSPIFTEHSEASISFNLKLLLAAQGKLLVIRSNGPRVVQFRCAPWIAVKTGQLSKLKLQNFKMMCHYNIEQQAGCFEVHGSTLEFFGHLDDDIGPCDCRSHLGERIGEDGRVQLGRHPRYFVVSCWRSKRYFAILLRHFSQWFRDIYIYTWTFDRINMMKVSDP